MSTNPVEHKHEVMYPSVHLTGADSKLANLPDSGSITFHYTKEETTTEKRKDKESYRCRLELHAITGVKADSSDGNEFEDREDAFSRYKAEAEAEDEAEDD